MNIQSVIALVNEMQAAGVIERYAIGGAVGATFYLEPVATLDADIFVAISPTGSSLLLSLQPIYNYLTARGCTVSGKYIMVDGWPIQFLLPTGSLLEEALEQAVTMDVDGTPVQVFTAEHLAVIALHTGRAKDKIRLLQFIEEGALEAARFEQLLQRHNLEQAWSKFEQQFLQE